MKSVAAATVALLATAVSAATYEQFPAGGLSCPTADGKQTSTLAEVKKAADSVVGTEPYEQSASNIASGKCSSLKDVPLYSATLGQASVGIAYDKAADTFYFCFGQGADTNGDGYPDGCTEL